MGWQEGADSDADTVKRQDGIEGNNLAEYDGTTFFDTSKVKIEVTALQPGLFTKSIPDFSGRVDVYRINKAKQFNHSSGLLAVYPDPAVRVYSNRTSSQFNRLATTPKFINIPG